MPFPEHSVRFRTGRQHLGGNAESTVEADTAYAGVTHGCCHLCDHEIRHTIIRRS